MKNIILKKSDLIGLLDEFDLQPNKSLGQHFLFEPNIIKKIASTIELTSKNNVLEIGPGLGNLTINLLLTGAKITAVEKDKNLSLVLPKVIAKYDDSLSKNLRVINEDILAIDEARIKKEGLEKIDTLVSNLPYNVAIKAFLQTVENFKNINQALIMTQLEAAERLCSTNKSKSKTYGIPAIKAAWYGESKIISSHIPGSVFYPKANVESALILFTRKDRLVHPNDSELEKAANFDLIEYNKKIKEIAFRVIDFSFMNRRKTMMNSVKKSKILDGVGYKKDFALFLENAQIDTKVRPENLSIDDYILIAQEIYESGCNK